MNEGYEPPPLPAGTCLRDNFLQEQCSRKAKGESRESERSGATIGSSNTVSGLVSTVGISPRPGVNLTEGANTKEKRVNRSHGMAAIRLFMAQFGLVVPILLTIENANCSNCSRLEDHSNPQETAMTNSSNRKTLNRRHGWGRVGGPSRLFLTALVASLAAVLPVDAGDPDDAGDGITGSTFGALSARSIGPALMSGRIIDIAVHPDRPAEYFVAAASGGVWKTVNNGTTFTPVFDGEGSYSIGCLAIDAENPQVVWVGTGENNSQRSVSFGDGVYKSVDGGRSWRNMGLRQSEHIGMITIDPRDSNVVYVAAQGPLWRSGGDRGVFKTVDGGETWNLVLSASTDTGANEVHCDPRNPDVLYASLYQRRRHVWTMINGGPESKVYKSEDAGQSWRTIERGLPGGDKGKIGLDVAPGNSDVIYAIVEAKDGQSGFFRSSNRGESWQKQSSYVSSAPMYYHEIIADPHAVDRIYMMDTYLQVSDDGGKTWRSIQGRSQHVDHHALWIDPSDETHLIVGCDGGVYETWDHAKTWHFKANLPITQFYRVAVDQALPFYHIYGGTQDNNTLGGPVRTNRRNISNEDWFVTVGGDGFETQVDPTDSNIVYSQWQYGGLVRHDRRSGENVDIKPRPKPGDDPYVFNWDAPLLLSPHSHERLYFGGRRLYRSDDRGNSWRAVSGDLSRGIDRNELEVMGKVWPVDAIAKHRSTSIYGSTVALSESPRVEGLIYVGTDDGLVHVTSDGGETWRKIDALPGIPYRTYVSGLTASRHDDNTVYASFDNHKNGDFKPYMLVSRDRGESWTPCVGNLGEREMIHSIVEDHVRPGLLFIGTEFGAHYSLDGGEKWFRVRGLPTISVQDIDIQRRENDLVLATFGRGFYIVDDYSPLQHVEEEQLKESAHIFPIKAAHFYIPGRKGRGSQGSSFWTAKNPPFGATITYSLGEDVKSGPELDTDATSPEYEKLREKERTFAPLVYLTIRDSAKKVVRRLPASLKKGVHRTSWDLRLFEGPWGPYALPGEYTVAVTRVQDGEVEELTKPVAFEVKHLRLGRFQPENGEEVRDFHADVVKLSRAVSGTQRAMEEAREQVDNVQRAIERAPEADPVLHAEAHALRVRLLDLEERMNGDPLPGRFQEPTLPGIRTRVRWATSTWGMTAPPTQTQRDAYEYAASDFERLLSEFRTLWETDLPAFRERLDDAGVPWTAGRLPTWNR